MKTGSRILIANRGEIALRAASACRRVGLSPVAVYSTADSGSLHVEAADEAVCIGPPPSRQSYLNQHALLHVARATACSALYPGYGFLAENAEFARRCADIDIKFVGPSAEAIERMGDKASARATAAALGVPVVPGSEHAFADLAGALSCAREIGFPLLLKATAGGGGKGMRVVSEEAEFAASFEQASLEAAEAFSNPAIYLERYFTTVRHIEVQVLADQHGNVQQLGERDCTLQRRHQKLLEESPSPVLSSQQRQVILDDALTLVKGIEYEGAGTIEFIFDTLSGEHYFIEMNTRIQVEHPVTEVRFDRDLVAEQLQIAMGKPVAAITDPLTACTDTHAIEFRINAEDPTKNFMPSPGRITRWETPAADNVRVDTFVDKGALVPPYYDSMLAKLIVTGRGRDDAVENARQALNNFHIEGISTTRDFHLAVLNHRDFQNGSIHTRWVEETFLPSIQTG